MIRYVGSAVARALCLAVLSLGLATSAVAQSVSGTILGTVTDSTGAVVAGAKVTIVNEGTGLTRTVIADANGEYTAPALPTGHYTITSEMTGFKTVALSNVEVGVDQRVRINIKLEVGAMTESVSITAETPLLQTSSSELGTTVSNEQIEALPLNGRNFVNLTRTDPRRPARHSRRQHRRRRQPRLARLGVVLGQRPAPARQQLHARRRRQQRDLAADGRHLPERRRARRVQAADLAPTRPSSAARSAASSTCRSSRAPTACAAAASSSTATTRSTPTTSSTTAPAAPSRTSSRTSSAAPSAAPVFKDKTFFFADYQGHRETQGQTFLSTVPTLAMRSGDFSELTRVIYDPTTGQPFPGNIIPSGRIDTVARNILTQLYPEPNTAGTRQAQRPDDQQLPDQPDQGAAGQPVRRQGRSQPDRRTTASSPATASRRRTALQPATLPHGDAGATFGAGDGNIKAQSLAFNDTQTLSANWLNEFRFGWSSIKFLMTPIDYGTNPGGRGRPARHQPERRRRRR